MSANLGLILLGFLLGFLAGLRTAPRTPRDDDYIEAIRLEVRALRLSSEEAGRHMDGESHRP